MSNRYYDAGPRATGQKVMLATTVYDNPDASYTFSIARSREALSAAGIQSAYYLLQGNCHVDDARNAVARDFLESDCTDLVFLDADVSWEPETLVALCRIDRDLVGGVYPYRREGDAETMPVRHLPEVAELDDDGLLEVEGLPTGFMKIKRGVIEAMDVTVSHFVKDERRPFPVIFERDGFGEGRRGGDIRFCMKWRERGGRVFAAPELRLGHCGAAVIRDSLAASLRRKGGETIAWMVARIKSGTDTIETYSEALRSVKSPWAASADVLHLAVGLARNAEGPVFEIGSGLSTLAMAATGAKIWCVEHDRHYADWLEEKTSGTGLKGIMLVTAPFKDGWYRIKDELPGTFGLAFVDGPPRQDGDRTRFFEAFGDRCRVILCDDADSGPYAAFLRTWAKSRNRPIQIDGRAAVILPAEK